MHWENLKVLPLSFFSCQPPAKSCLEGSLFPASSSTKPRAPGGPTRTRRELPPPRPSRGRPKAHPAAFMARTIPQRESLPRVSLSLLVPLLRGFGRGGSRKEERAHQLVTVQKQMYIPARSSGLSVSNFFGTALRSERLIPKAPLPAPPALYLCRSFAFDYELVTAGGVLWGTPACHTRDGGTKPGQQEEQGQGRQHVEGAHTAPLPVGAAQALRNYPLKKEGEKMNRLNYWL